MEMEKANSRWMEVVRIYINECLYVSLAICTETRLKIRLNCSSAIPFAGVTMSELCTYLFPTVCLYCM